MKRPKLTLEKVMEKQWDVFQCIEYFQPNWTQEEANDFIIKETPMMTGTMTGAEFIDILNDKLR